jgi:hypothetical protein
MGAGEVIHAASCAEPTPELPEARAQQEGKPADDSSSTKVHPTAPFLWA